MASPPKPKLTPFQRAAGQVGQSNAEFIFQNRDPEQMATVGDDAWGQVLKTTKEMVANKQGKQKPDEPPAEEPAPPPTSAPVTSAPPPPPPKAPVPQRRPRSPEAGDGSSPRSPGRTGKGQLRTDKFAQAASTGLQLPR